MTGTFDIRAKAPFRAGALSNFAPHRFVFDGVRCACMEGLLQSLKISDQDEQRRVCDLTGPDAQSIGRKHDWSVTGTLWWNGKAIDRLSDEYQDLLDRAYEALFAQSESFRAALTATGSTQLVHNLGKSDPHEPFPHLRCMPSARQSRSSRHRARLQSQLRPPSRKSPLAHTMSDGQRL